VVMIRVIAQVNNKISFILSLGIGRVSRFRTVATVTDRRYIQNNSTVSFGLFAGVTLHRLRDFAMRSYPMS
jgi:hypothetical protein